MGWAPGRALLSFFVPGGVLLLAAELLAAFAPARFTGTAFLDAISCLVLAAGVALAWRFHSSRVLFALLALSLADWALVAWVAHPASPGSARAVLALVALLIPANLAFFCLLGEFGLALESLGYGLGILLVEAVAVAVLARPENAGIVSWLDHRLLGEGWLGWSRMPQFCLLAFAVAFVLLAARWVIHRKPVENAFFWSLAAAFLALQLAPARSARLYLVGGGIILMTALVETSYRLAYQDELTGLPARRALNEALLAAGNRFVVAMVDVDHFKKFNDTFGHDAGDQVLRMVASRLAGVGGDGEAFRYGGEEFCILFVADAASEVLPHLEKLRAGLEKTRFMVRGPDRSQRWRRERRYSSSHRRPVGKTRAGAGVTISIGLAEASGRHAAPEQVLLAADEALYRAKQAGRNRIEVAGRRAAKSIAD